LQETGFQWKFAEETHKYVREYIRLADQKAAFFFAGGTALLTFLYKAKLMSLWLKLPTAWTLVDILSLLATVGLSVSALSAVWTVVPRLRGSRRGLIFFSAICEFTGAKDYCSEVLRKTARDLVEQKVAHIYELARICETKFKSLRVSIWFGAVGLAATVFLLFLAS
jgi:hypothetical protein